MPNPNIGRIKCPMCEATVAVRQASRGARSLYIYCAHDGMITPNLPGGQAYIQSHAEFYDDDSTDGETAEKTVTEKPAEKTHNERGGWLL